MDDTFFMELRQTLGKEKYCLTIDCHTLKPDIMLHVYLKGEKIVLPKELLLKYRRWYLPLARDLWVLVLVTNLALTTPHKAVTVFIELI